MSFGKETLAELPKPHGSDALIVFDGKEMPYSQNVDNPGNNGDNSRGSDIVDERTAREIEREKPAVRRRYEGTPGWMKAPNGKDTNLTEEQWLAARTKAFKGEYGDWEAIATKEQLIHGDAVPIADDGLDFGEKQQTLWRKLVADYRNSKKGASRALLQFVRSLIPDSITNKALGKIVFSNNSIRNSLHHGQGKANALVLPYIQNILENAEYIGTRPNGKDKTSYVLAKPILYNSVTSGQPQRFIMLMVINEDRTGKKYYDHEFTTIKKIDALPAVLRENTETTEKRSEHQSLVSILAEEIWNVNDVSIAVDENGEPIFNDIPGKPDTERKPAPEREKQNTEQEESRSDNQGGFSYARIADIFKLPKLFVRLSDLLLQFTRIWFFIAAAYARTVFSRQFRAMSSFIHCARKWQR